MNNINERMAKVMGWQLLKEGEEFPFFVREYDDQIAPSDVYITDTEIKYWVGGWHPDTSIEQAMMVARKIIETEHKFYTIVELSLYPNGIDVTIEKYKLRASDSDYPVHKWLAVGEIGEEAKAICEAILETMDENNIIPLNLDMEAKDE